MEYEENDKPKLESMVSQRDLRLHYRVNSYIAPWGLYRIQAAHMVGRYVKQSCAQYGSRTTANTVEPQKTRTRTSRALMLNYVLRGRSTLLQPQCKSQPWITSTLVNTSPFHPTISWKLQYHLAKVTQWRTAFPVKKNWKICTTAD